ncbi:ubiquinol-cytochrome c reductase iron-sulfur subunit [Neptuniibacter pectenicola]|jgi:ubiquinol-cytochrome c reductase iron-sulfur subunit|uniref:ubiquinol-cytochrome c reductase iron-sulfur subunit n=1 Tax=Neptuniibacter pectenicola TaxID=1806669 RepID=UPI0030EB3CA8|tara:strand:+ start:1634 stop:2227 length:594 start_codon:yes stop_codon:yes gene_type:complete|eukprot:gnl/Carplike_NY0171/4351_a5902_407.p1 GENE.gnl/Carplike_NY0171/4351_a5902_407~~gnl/Carplike_NY0171/4351_a5902_407.p1  ORF type:complete len:198 (-),score=31.72 gnl/Carplike_NY0171/4351_a5902_407:336-929(-)
MSNDGVNKGRRRLLIGATSAVGAVGAVGAAVPFVASWNPSAKARTAGAPVKVDISKLEVGQQMVAKWRGKPVWIVRRSEEALADLAKLDNLQDPNSEAPQQPAYVPTTPARAIREDVSVLVGICTHLGCSPTYRPEIAPADLGEDWVGGYYCPCHGSRFDLSGRVMNGSPAPTNLVIPPHRYESDSVIIVGVDQESA